MPLDPRTTTEAFKRLVSRQGGGLHFSDDTYYSLDSPAYVTSIRRPDGFKPFIISIYNARKDSEELSLTLLVNPNDIQIGQVFVNSSALTRKGWVTTLWGRQQSTLTANGVSAAFYYDSNQVSITNGAWREIHEGLVNYYRKESLGFINFLTLVSLFKNNGYYHMNTPDNQTIFRDGTSRVITVFDQIKISYDGTEYLGSFSNFTLNESPEAPYRLDYNFEFIISGLRGDEIEGHIRQEDNNLDPRVEVSIQGQYMGFQRTVRLSAEELNEKYKMRDTPPEYDIIDYGYSEEEFQEEYNYYNDGRPFETGRSAGYWDTPEGKARTATVSPNTTKVTAGGRSVSEHHKDKIDYRTASGQIASLSDGIIYSKGQNYVVIKTKIPYKGRMVGAYVRYYHLDSETITRLKDGTRIQQGTRLGIEGTDNGKYPPHCDLLVKIYEGTNVSYGKAKKINASDFFYKGVNDLKNKNFSDYQKLEHKGGEKHGVS